MTPLSSRQAATIGAHSVHVLRNSDWCLHVTVMLGSPVTQAASWVSAAAQECQKAIALPRTSGGQHVALLEPWAASPRSLSPTRAASRKWTAGCRALQQPAVAALALHPCCTNDLLGITLMDALCRDGDGGAGGAA